MRPIHVWSTAHTGPVTRCGQLLVTSYGKPNVISTKHATRLNAVTNQLCKRCIKNLKRSSK